VRESRGERDEEGKKRCELRKAEETRAIDPHTSTSPLKDFRFFFWARSSSLTFKKRIARVGRSSLNVTRRIPFRRAHTISLPSVLPLPTVILPLSHAPGWTLLSTPLPSLVLPLDLPLALLLPLDVQVPLDMPRAPWTPLLRFPPSRPFTLSHQGILST